jgi:hypothetical protein
MDLVALLNEERDKPVVCRQYRHLSLNRAWGRRTCQRPAAAMEKATGMPNVRHAGRLAVIALGGSMLGVAATAAEPNAVTLLFESNHLAGISKPAELRYAFRRGGSLEPSFDDMVVLRVMELLPSGGKRLEFEFLTGDRQIPFPLAAEFRGNPLIMLFLERDSREMGRMTGGTSHYFRNRIRGAIRDSAEVKPISFDFAGKAVRGSEVTIHPYADDPRIDRYRHFSAKSYSFMVSEAVPGSLYRIRTATPLAEGGPLIIEETMTLLEGGK